MKSFVSVSPILLAALVGLLVDPNPPYSVTAVEAEPPKALAEAIRKTLEPKSYIIKDADGTTWCQIWFRKDIPAKKNFKPSLNVKYPFESGELIGAVLVPEESDFEDFRQQIIEPGVYTLRFCLQLEDGNHVGTSETRDFLTLQLADEDQDPARMDPDEMMELSKNAAMSDHPAILYLLAPASGEKGSPEMEWDEQNEYAILRAKVSTTNGPITVRLIVVGYTEE